MSYQKYGSKFLRRAVKAFPPSQYQKYEKWRTGEGFGITYVLSKSMAQDFIIDYVSRESFTSELKRQIWGGINHSELKNMIRKRRHQVKAVISKISIDILLRDLPKSLKEIILDHEDEIKNMFNIKIFADYRFLEKPALSEALSKFLPKAEKENADEYSSIIVSESQKFYDLLRELGITM